MGLVGDIAGGILGAVNTGYNIYTNKRDFDYQKALQQIMFEREDTAVQRRMADLQASGINPNLAAGQGAGAGAVVSRSNTNDVNFGSALDMIQAVNQIRLQRQQKENAEVENRILKDTEYVKDNERYVSMAETLAKLGIPFYTSVKNNGKFFNLKVSPNQEIGNYSYLGPDSPIQQLLDYQTSSARNSADLLQKDNDYYTGDKVAGYLGTILGIINKLR